MKRLHSRFSTILALSLTAAATGCAPATDDADDVTDEGVESSTYALGALPTIELLPSVVDGQAVALTITNTTTSPVYCRVAAFRAPIQRLDHCGEPPLSNEFIDLSPLTLAPSEQKRWADTPEANAGGLLGREHLAAIAEERRRQGFQDELLEYCPMGATERALDCGYYCTQGGAAHHYGEEWRITNGEGGYSRYRCDADGTIATLEVKCEGELPVGGTKRIPGGEGYTMLLTCQPDATFLRTAECSAGYQQTADRQACVPASCGVVAHGGEYFVRPLEHGRIVTTCRFGSPDPGGEHAVCNADWVPNATGNDCVPRPMRACGTVPHGWSQTYQDCGPQGAERVRQWCADGVMRETRHRTGRHCD